MVPDPLAGHRFRGHLSRFEQLGSKMHYSGNVSFMQVPIVGHSAFVEEWAEQTLAIICKVLVGVQRLPRQQVVFYLLRDAGHWLQNHLMVTVLSQEPYAGLC